MQKNLTLLGFISLVQLQFFKADGEVLLLAHVVKVLGNKTSTEMYIYCSVYLTTSNY